MPHTIEPATTGRAKCRACGAALPAGQLRFGERVPNPFGDDGSETTHWYHPRCGAFTRPEAFVEALTAFEGALDERESLLQAAAAGVAHHRLPRVRAAESAPTGRATCRHCKTLIAKGAWRLALAYYEDGRFSPSGYIHIACARGYLETTDILDRLRYFSPALSPEAVQDIEREITRE